DAVLLGTPQYMAPEQALGKNTELDGRTDIFALGAIVYEMLSGRPAFMGNTLAEVVFKVVYDKHPPLAEPDVPQSVVDAVETALAKEPAQRYPDVATFINALTGRPLPTRDRGRATNPAAFAATAAPPSSGAASGAGLATTGARGQLTPAIPPTTAPRAGASDGKKAAFIAGALLAVIGGAVGIIKLTHKEPPVDTPPVGVATVKVPSGTSAVPSGTTASGAALVPSGTSAVPSGTTASGAALVPSGTSAVPSGTT